MIDFARLTPRTSRPVLGLLALLLVGSAGCGGAATMAAHAPTASAGLTPEENARRLEGFMSREHGPFTQHEVTFLEGDVTATIEAASKPTVACDDGGCAMVAPMGKDADGNDSSIVCRVKRGVEPFGPLVIETVGEDAEVTDSPRFTSREAGEGLAVSFVANAQRETDEDLLVSTPKIAMLYARGYVASCVDVQSGGRKTFERVVGGFYDGLHVHDEASDKAVFAAGHQLRVGERPFGFRYGVVSRRAGGGSASGSGTGSPAGFQEINAAFGFEAQGAKWRILDSLVVVRRDAAGAVEDMRQLDWIDGKGPFRISAKPAEGKKMRVKLEIGSTVNALELTPLAPANTQLWAAPDLLAVSSGRAPSYTYSVPGLDDHDPALHTRTLKRTAPGVLIETDSSKKDAKGTPREGDELHVDARGVVTKEVSSAWVSELVFSWGEVPSGRARGTVATKLATKAAGSASRGAK